MPLKKEPCRNFQRGSCRYGDKCKFLHITQQQTRPNAFGFGSQTGSSFQQTNLQQQKPNPFGFGVQSGGPAGGGPNSVGFRQSNAFKPFENKWIRSEQPASQSQAASHRCTDPEFCKRQIAEDFEQERPLWKLTCYGHDKYLPCDVTGDVSYEELRAASYDDAKRGIPLHSIVERERNLLNLKLVEFENVLRNPYSKQINSAQANQSHFPAVGPNASSIPVQNTGPPAISGFGQLSPSHNMAFGVRPTTPENNIFGQFQGSTGPFATNNMPSASFGSKVPLQTSANPFTSSTLPVLPQIQTSVFNQSPAVSIGSMATDGIEKMSMNTELIGNNVSQEVSASVWMKEEWKLGEIPEQPPPPQFVR